MIINLSSSSDDRLNRGNESKRLGGAFEKRRKPVKRLFALVVDPSESFLDEVVESPLGPIHLPAERNDELLNAYGAAAFLRRR